ncbi:MAG: hypothetical protein MJY95_08430 [Bacteroidaceae bacterium]|nr:hypothetical protein [Bacteroidaceae bacterium]
MQKIAQQSKTLASEMKAVTSSFDKATTSQEKNEAKGAVLSKQIESQKKYIQTLTEAIKEEISVSGEDAISTQKLIAQKNNAVASLNGLQKEFNELGTEEEKTKDKTSLFGDVLKSNLASDFIMSGLSALKDTLKEIGKGIKEAYTGSVKWADDLATLSVVTGLSTEALQEYEYMAGLIDTDVDTITGALSKLTTNMNKARDGTGASAEAFEALGIAVTNDDGTLRDNAEVFDEIITKLGELPEGAERDALAMELVGRSAKELNPLISAGADTIEALRKEAHETGYVMSDELMKGLLESADASDRTKARMDGLKRELSAKLAPAITELQDGFLKLFDEVDFDAVSKDIGDIVKGFKEFCNWVKSNKDIILALFAGISAGFAAFSIGSVIMALIGYLKQFETVQAAVNAVLAMNPLMLIATAIGLVIAGTVLLIKNWDKVKEVATNVWNTVRDGVVTAWNTITTKVSELGTKIKEAFVEIKGKIGDWVHEHIIDPFKEKVESIKEVGKNLILGLWEGINDKIQWIREKISGFCDDIENWFKNFFGIHSPSTKTAWMGEMLMSGLAKGIGEGKSLVNDAWYNATSNLGVNAQSSMSASGRSAGSVINLYAQTIDEATIDYLYTRINDRMGVYV